MIIFKIIAWMAITAIMFIVGPVAIGIWVVVNLLYVLLVAGGRR